jgi:hypothetical protein
MEQTTVLIVGASVAGLACAACLQKQGIGYIIIEKQDRVASPWRHHYDRLHLHTSKNLSNLPYKKFDNNLPRYPSRQAVVDYLDSYQTAFNIQPVFNTEALSIKKEGDRWTTGTSNGIFSSSCVVMATGAYGRPRAIQFTGMDSFPGKIVHSSQYKTGAAFTGQNVLVVGFGNSACEIAIDLYEQGALPSMSVRSPVNVIPRDVLGIPVLALSLLLRPLPPRVADSISAPMMRLLLGNLTRLGLQKKAYGPLEEINRYGQVPLLDVGTIKHVQQGHIKLKTGIDCIAGKTIHFTNGHTACFDAIVAAIGYERNYADLLQVDSQRFEDLCVSARKQQYFGKDGLYFCGYWISPTGQFREIAADAKKIARHISRIFSLQPAAT